MYMWIYRSEKDCELAVEVSGWRSERRARGLLAMEVLNARQEKWRRDDFAKIEVALFESGESCSVAKKR